MMNARWNLATASYWTFRPGYGVPIRTSIGTPKDLRYATVEARPLYPFSSFRKAETDEEGKRLYQAYLTKHRDQIAAMLDELTATYGPDLPLTFLCFEGTANAMGGGCHRRWLADWLRDTFEVVVPEVGVKVESESPVTPAPVPDPWEQESMF
jgi:hypothetical protein